MGCHGDSCDVNASQVRVKAVSAEQRAEVEVFLRDLFDRYVCEGKLDLAEKLFQEELKEMKNK